MYFFYAQHIVDDFLTLDDQEAHHCLHVLRKKVGDEIFVLDGKGALLKAVLRESKKKSCRAEILHVEKTPPPSVRLHVAIAPPKNISRLEWFLEKATELGIGEISLIRCDYSERRVVKPERLQKIVIAAMKQSMRRFLPQVNNLAPFAEWMTKNDGAREQKFIAHCNKGQKFPLSRVLQSDRNTTILIGPEGDFSENEVEMARSQAFTEVTFGNNRLRTETAGVAVCSLFMFLNQL